MVRYKSDCIVLLDSLPSYVQMMVMGLGLSEIHELKGGIDL